MSRLVQDLRYAFRMLARTPGFTAVAGISLALGIGANTAIFSLTYAVLMRPLEVDDPERLVTVFSRHESGGPYGTSSYPDYRDFRDQSDVFSGLAAHTMASHSFPRRSMSSPKGTIRSTTDIGVQMSISRAAHVPRKPSGVMPTTVVGELLQFRFFTLTETERSNRATAGHGRTSRDQRLPINISLICEAAHWVSMFCNTVVLTATTL